VVTSDRAAELQQQAHLEVAAGMSTGERALTVNTPLKTSSSCTGLPERCCKGSLSLQTSQHRFLAFDQGRHCGLQASMAPVAP
jgi:hypothetical protein